MQFKRAERYESRCFQDIWCIPPTAKKKMQIATALMKQTELEHGQALL